MKQVSIYLECDCTAFRKHKRICGYVLEYIRKNGDAETREEFRAAEGTYHREILQNPVRSAWAHPGTMYHLHLQPGRLCLQHAHKETAGVGRQRFTSNGKPIANQEEWRTVWEKIKIHKASTCIGKHSYTDWMLAEMEERFEKKEQRNKRASYKTRKISSVIYAYCWKATMTIRP